MVGSGSSSLGWGKGAASLAGRETVAGLTTPPVKLGICASVSGKDCNENSGSLNILYILITVKILTHLASPAKTLVAIWRRLLVKSGTYNITLFPLLATLEPLS
jgi:hypothetical protein